ncbi:hypothetical protein SLA2020_518810 [Shorea laevis]
MAWHVSFSGSDRPAAHRHLEPPRPPELLENKIAIQAAEIEQLALDKHKLAVSLVALGQETAVAQQEAQNVKAHIKSIQIESDIQVRVLLEKIAKMEVDIGAGENVKKDLQQAHFEVQSMVKARQELTAKIQQASQELQKTYYDRRKIPQLHSELDSWRKEHQRLRATFQHEKSLNIEQVEKMQAVEKNLILMGREVDKLQAEIRNSELTFHGPIPLSFSGGHYLNSNTSYPASIQGGSAYVVGYGIPPMMPVVVNHVPERIMAFGSGILPAPAAVPGADAVWGGPYDPSLAQG